MPCRELRFCLWYFMWSTKIRKTVFVQKVAEIKRKHPKSEDFRCCSVGRLQKRCRPAAIAVQWFSRLIQ